MAKISIYYNQLASHTNSLNLHEELKKHLFRHQVQLKTFPSIAELRLELKAELQNQTQYIFAIGGDGTANTFIQELAGSSIKLFIIPAGTANDLAGELGIQRSLKQIIKIFQTKSSSKIDLVDINSKLMATNGGLGLPTTIAQRINLLRKRLPGFKILMRLFKKNIYTIFLAVDLIAARIKTYTIKITSSELGKSLVVTTPMILINNQEILAGSFPVAPHTNNADGKFNVTVFTHPNRVSLIKCILAIKAGRYPTNDPHLLSFETNKVRLENLDADNIAFFGDGEILSRTNYFEVKTSDKKIDMFCAQKEQKVEHAYHLDLIESL